MEKEESETNKIIDKKLVSFGNYLLSDKRIVSDMNKKNVTHADIKNWEDLQENIKNQ